MSYEEIKTEIKNAPMSFLPGLLVCVVKTSLEKKVFRPGGAARVAQEVENEHTETVNAMPNNKIRHGGPDA